MEAKWPLSEDEERTLLTKLSSIEKQIFESLAGRDRTIYRKALRETKSAVLSDYKKAPPVLRPFLWDVFHRLVDTTFKVTESLTDHGLRSGDYAARFRQFVGKSPKKYFESVRIDFAQKIIDRSRIFIGDIGGLVGYEIPSSFSRSFKRVKGNPPQKERTGTSVDSSIDPRVSPNTAEVGSREIKVDLTAFWKKVHNYRREQLRDYMIRRAEEITIDHVYYLLEKAKYEGRVNRDRGEELARSALDALKLVELWTGEQFIDEYTLLCATIGNHCKLCFDLDQAEQWSQQALRLLPDDLSQSPLLYSQVNFFRVSLLWWRRCVEESKSLYKSILPIIREHGSYELLTRSLLLGAEIYDSSGHPDQALPYLSEAVKLKDFVSDPYVTFSAHYNMTLLYTRLEMPAKAKNELQVVQELHKDVHVSPCYVARLEGKVFLANRESRAESLLLSARTGFINDDLDIYAALTSLELSSLYLGKGDSVKAFQMAKSAIPPISRFSCHKESIAALALLQDAVKSQCVTEPVVKKILHHVEMVHKDPTSELAKNH